MKRVVFSNSNYRGFGLSEVTDGQSIPEHPAYCKDAVTPTFFFSLKNYELTSRFVTSDPNESLDLEVDLAKYDGKLAEMKDQPEFEYNKFRVISGLASVRNESDGMLSDEFHILRYGKHESVKLDIREAPVKFPMASVGCVVPSMEHWRWSEEYVWVAISLPPSQFADLWGELNNEVASERCITVSLDMDFKNLLYSWDPIGGEPRTIAIVNNPKTDIENFEEIPEEVLPFIGGFSKAVKPVGISVSNKYSAKQQSTEIMDQEEYDDYSLNSASSDGSVHEETVTFQKLYELEQIKSERVMKNLSIARVLAFVFFLSTLLGWLYN